MYERRESQQVVRALFVSFDWLLKKKKKNTKKFNRPPSFVEFKKQNVKNGGIATYCVKLVTTFSLRSSFSSWWKSLKGRTGKLWNDRVYKHNLVISTLDKNSDDLDYALLQSVYFTS